MKANIVEIKRFAVHDGDGIRTTVFFKGCPLKCLWCHNPETLSSKRQLAFYGHKCIGCGKCAEVCGCHTFSENVHKINKTNCTVCGKCAEVCPQNALEIFGTETDTDEICMTLLKDKDFYTESGGGITLSGGEALLQWQFCRDLLKQCKEEGIHTCVESALHVRPKAIDEVAPYVDLFITDSKQMDSATHKKFTGVGNELILSNIKKLVEMDMPLIIRMPIIPGFNDNETYIDAASDFILNELHNKPEMIQMLKYRPLGEEKAGTLGLPLQMKGMKVEDREGFELQIRGYVKRMNDKGIPAIPGTKKKKEKENE